MVFTGCRCLYCVHRLTLLFPHCSQGQTECTHTHAYISRETVAKYVVLWWLGGIVSMLVETHRDRSILTSVCVCL